MKTALQELKEDLQESINGLPDTLKGINDLFVIKTVTDAVLIAYNCVLKRIDSELLEKAKQQIIDAYNDGGEKGFNKFGENAEQYYNETYNQK